MCVSLNCTLCPTVLWLLEWNIHHCELQIYISYKSSNLNFVDNLFWCLCGKKERIVLLHCFRPDPVTIFAFYILFYHNISPNKTWFLFLWIVTISLKKTSIKCKWMWQGSAPAPGRARAGCAAAAPPRQATRPPRGCQLPPLYYYNDTTCILTQVFCGVIRIFILHILCFSLEQFQ